MATGGDLKTAPGYSSLNGDQILADLANMVVGDSDAHRNVAELFIILNTKIEAQKIELENLVVQPWHESKLWKLI